MIKLLSAKNIFAAIAGSLLTFSYSPFNIWPISILSLAIIFYCCYQENWRNSAKYGFIFGLTWFGAGISWVHVPISEFGGLPLPVSLLLMLLLSGYLALYPALAFAITSRFRTSDLQGLALFLPLYAVIEYIRATFLTGFPWLSLGYTLTDSPLAKLAPVIGEFGLALTVIILAYGLMLICKNSSKLLLIASSIVLLILYFFSGQLHTLHYNNHEIKLALVQGNIEQNLKWDPTKFWPTMLKYQDLTRKNWDVDLVIWPEAAIPELEVLANEYLTNLDSAAAFNNTALITGIVDYQRDTKAAYNNLIVLGKKNTDDTLGHYRYLHKNRYRKHHLVPIGEFVPFEGILRPLAPLFDLPMSSFNQGDRIQKNLTANGINILPAICYEIVFADQVRDNYQANSDILLTVSNDAWFGDSHGPDQHMQIARMRSLELGRPLVRVTNNGITGVFDPITQSEQTLEQFETGVLKTRIKKISGETFYAKYGKTPIWCLLTLLFIFSGIRFFQNKNISSALTKDILN